MGQRRDPSRSALARQDQFGSFGKGPADAFTLSPPFLVWHALPPARRLSPSRHCHLRFSPSLAFLDFFGLHSFCHCAFSVPSDRSRAAAHFCILFLPHPALHRGSPASSRLNPRFPSRLFFFSDRLLFSRTPRHRLTPSPLVARSPLIARSSPFLLCSSAGQSNPRVRCLRSVQLSPYLSYLFSLPRPLLDAPPVWPRLPLLGFWSLCRPGHQRRLGRHRC